MDPSAPLEVVCVASLQPQKGHRVLVEAIGLLYAKGVRVHCVLVGDGPELDSLRGLVADLHLETVVELAGALTRPDVIARLQAADVMALASVPLPSGKMEGIPVALMEGMAMELPARGR